jgi:predicted ATP-grasp superfamily ATP-dependent carboligase
MTRQSPALTDSAGYRAGISGFDALVLDGNYRQSMRVTHNLGRAGLRVAVGEAASECSPHTPGFQSRYCARSVVFPSYTLDPAAYADAVLDFIRENPTRVILPTGDGSISALSARRADFSALGTALAIAPEGALAIANDKDRTLRLAGKLGIDYPRSLPVGSLADLRTAAVELGFPMVLKPVTSWAHAAGSRVAAVVAVDETEARDVAGQYLASGVRFLAQEYAVGRREGVTLMIVAGEVIVSFAHTEHRTMPQLGGASTLRESIAMPADIQDSAIRLAKAIGIEGACAVEFRRNREGRPLLMEVNARIGGALDSVTSAGIDLPVLLWQWATGQQVQRPASYRAGVRTRWLQGDIRWLGANLNRVGRPDSEPMRRALLMFIGEFARTWRYDYFSFRDPKPGLAELRLCLNSVFRFAALMRARKSRAAEYTGLAPEWGPPAEAMRK